MLRIRSPLSAIVLVLAGSAAAQSRDLLEAVRLYRPSARKLAEAELDGCAPPACDSKARLRLLAGYLALSDGDAHRALELLAEDPPAELAPFAAFYLGQAQFYAGDPTSAAASFALAQTNAPGHLVKAARAREGEALLAAGLPTLAAPVLEEAARELGRPELYYQRALARRAVGHLDGERADLELLVRRYPSHPYAALAWSLLTTKGAAPLTLTLDDRLYRAKELLESGDVDSAVAEIEILRKSKALQGASALAKAAYIHAQALYAKGDATGAEKQIRIALNGQSFVAADAALLRARYALRKDNNEVARKLFAEIDSRFTRENAAEEAGYLVGWLDLQGGRFKSAASAFETFERRHPKSRRRDEALWFRSYALIRGDDYAGARAQLLSLLQRFSRSALVPQGRYWAARTLELGKLTGADSTAEYQELIDLFPGSYYAMLARERLKAAGKPIPPGFTAPGFSVPRASTQTELPDTLKLAASLTRAGLFRDAAEECEAVANRINSSEGALRLGHALVGLEEFGHAFSLATRLLWGKAYWNKDAAALALFYPQAFRTAVEREAQKSGVDPFLVWSIMRRESGFRPEVASLANARGLMQIIPKTAEAIAKSLNLTVPAVDDLFSPNLNVRFGSWYLAQLVKRFSHPALVAAAYNAGPDAVLKWTGQTGKLPLDLFVEHIPFKETRAYVKQVVADHLIYHSLYGDETKAPGLELAVPTPGQGVGF